MSESKTTTVAQRKQPRLSFGDVLTHAGDFFMERGAVYETMRRLARRLEEEGIPYALVGGMALAAHGLPRLTLAVDVLMTAEGLRRFRERFIGRGYVPAFEGAQKSFIDAESRIRIEVATAGEFPGDGLPKPVAFPDPAGRTVEHDRIRVIQLPTLIELKLACGLTAPDRLRDLADVQDLIVALELPLDLEEKLDPSVRAEYRRLWEMARRGSERSNA